MTERKKIAGGVLAALDKLGGELQAESERRKRAEDETKAKAKAAEESARRALRDVVAPTLQALKAQIDEVSDSDSVNTTILPNECTLRLTKAKGERLPHPFELSFTQGPSGDIAFAAKGGPLQLLAAEKVAASMVTEEWVILMVESFLNKKPGEVHEF